MEQGAEEDEEIYRTDDRGAKGTGGEWQGAG